MLEKAMKLKVDLITMMKQKQIQASNLLILLKKLRNFQKSLRNELN